VLDDGLKAVPRPDGVADGDLRELDNDESSDDDESVEEENQRGSKA
jgi:hypothetical protein